MMPIIVSVGSGKGGTGKSLVASNVAAILSARGENVYLLDLDVGGADAHVLYGLFKTEHTLTDFLCGRVSHLDEVATTLQSFHGLKLIVGTGETLRTANMPYGTKKRLIKQIRHLSADIVIVDVGAGTNLNTLDFFIASDIQVCVSTLDPTSILDFYRFLKLATIRKVLSSFLARDEVTKAISQRDFQKIDEVLEFADKVKPGAGEVAKRALEDFTPALILNQVRSGSSAMDRIKLKHVVTRFLGIELPELGVIPWDEKVIEAIRSYMPVVEYAPESKASLALRDVGRNLLALINRKRAEMER